nr:uncharacterized protein LOC121829976 [Peromyscus maniculatus bairdii]
MLLTLSLGEAIGARQAGGGRRPGLSERRASATPTELAAARPGLLPAAPLPRRRRRRGERLSLLSNAGLAGLGHFSVPIRRGQPLSLSLFPLRVEKKRRPAVMPAARLQRAVLRKVPLLPPNKASLEPMLPLGGRYAIGTRGRPDTGTRKAELEVLGPTVQ